MKSVGDTYILDYDVTNGYTTNLNTGTSYYSDQTVTISNNFNAVDSTCTITMALRNYAAKNSSYAATANSEAATKNIVAATATTTNANAKTTYTSMQVNGCDCSYPGCRHSGGYQGVGGVPDGHCAIYGVGWNNQGMTVQVPHTTYSCPSGKILSGTKCISYSCSNGTLSGTNCIYYTCGAGKNLDGTTCKWNTCPDGGTLSGSTCVKYTCPNGGTLNGTTCEF